MTCIHTQNRTYAVTQVCTYITTYPRTHVTHVRFMKQPLMKSVFLLSRRYMGFRYLSHHMPAANAQTSLCIHAALPQPLLPLYTKQMDWCSLRKIRQSEHKWSFCEYGISTKMSYAGPYLFCLYVVLVLGCSVSGRVRGQEMVWIWRGWFWCFHRPSCWYKFPYCKSNGISKLPYFELANCRPPSVFRFW